MQSERIKELEDKLATERNGYGQLWNDYQKLKKQNAELEKRVGEWIEPFKEEIKYRPNTLCVEVSGDDLFKLEQISTGEILSEGGVNENEK